MLQPIFMSWIKILIMWIFSEKNNSYEVLGKRVNIQMVRMKSVLRTILMIAMLVFIISTEGIAAWQMELNIHKYLKKLE